MAFDSHNEGTVAEICFCLFFSCGRLGGCLLWGRFVQDPHPLRLGLQVVPVPPWIINPLTWQQIPPGPLQIRARQVVAVMMAVVIRSPV